MPLISYPYNENRPRSKYMTPGVPDPMGTRGRPPQRKVCGDSSTTGSLGLGLNSFSDEPLGCEGERFLFVFIVVFFFPFKTKVEKIR